ncbi:cell wall protein DAN4-like isoform X2 [Lingula anatina]|uniref:Cell wall protein DAN4-like isoform X2 n=1 Tax=Lingula anatina TaxID=7574 RepID=A0A1S3KAB4_LINAN|nr:cell wall protein DAN4-like isoform X2 [Lingula anatina]|eukprot:XP_013419442.1 cell wall protein DAN4-like isoform X2 [Lingula anatina]
MRYFLVTLCVTLVLLRDAFSQTTSPTTSGTAGNTTEGTTPGTTAGGTTPSATTDAAGTGGTTPSATTDAAGTGGTTPSATTGAAGTGGTTPGYTGGTTPAPSENTTAAPAPTTTQQSDEAAMRDVQRKIAYTQFMIGKMDELMIKYCPSYPPTYVPEATYNITRRRRQEEADDRQIEKLKLMQYLFKCLLDDLIDKYLDCKLSPPAAVPQK